MKYEQILFSGLMQKIENQQTTKITDREHIPIRRGLRQLSCFCLIQRYEDREHIPIRRGLRQYNNFTTNVFIKKDREHIPIRRGLRPI